MAALTWTRISQIALENAPSSPGLGVDCYALNWSSYLLKQRKARCEQKAKVSRALGNLHSRSREKKHLLTLFFLVSITKSYTSPPAIMSFYATLLGLPAPLSTFGVSTPVDNGRLSQGQRCYPSLHPPGIPSL